MVPAPLSEPTPLSAVESAAAAASQCTPDRQAKDQIDLIKIEWFANIKNEKAKLIQRICILGKRFTR
jgi:hypothetical protein